ncbi:MAG: nuclease [Rhodospirillales bacterium]|jgi:endonuclease YncB( thermonuclease family)|nr:nuclease [Rhodospirillales bacterium]
MQFKFIRLLIFAALFFGLTPGMGGVKAGGELKGHIRARVIRVVDGDTLLIRTRIWLGQEVETRLRLANIDAPELKGRCEGEKELARAARWFVQDKIGKGPVVLRDIHYGKFAGRMVARLETEAGEDVGRAFRSKGLGRAYKGGKRKSWC